MPSTVSTQAIDMGLTKTFHLVANKRITDFMGELKQKGISQQECDKVKCLLHRDLLNDLETAKIPVYFPKTSASGGEGRAPAPSPPPPLPLSRVIAEDHRDPDLAPSESRFYAPVIRGLAEGVLRAYIRARQLHLNFHSIVYEVMKSCTSAIASHVLTNVYVHDFFVRTFGENPTGLQYYAFWHAATYLTEAFHYAITGYYVEKRIALSEALGIILCGTAAYAVRISVLAAGTQFSRSLGRYVNTALGGGILGLVVENGIYYLGTYFTMNLVNG